MGLTLQVIILNSKYRYVPYFHGRFYPHFNIIHFRDSMVDFVEIGLILQTISVMSAATATVIGVRSYINSNKRAEESRKRELETRQAQLFMQIYQSANSSEVNEAEFMLNGIEFKNLDEWNKAMKDKKMYKAFMIYGGIFEGIGVLVRENLIEVRLPSLMMSGNIAWFWERYKTGILEIRDKLNWPRFLVEVEYLYGRVKEYEREHPELRIRSPSTT
jgi:hypothetical protein